MSDRRRWELNERQMYYLIYSALFAAAALLVFSGYFLKKELLIWKVDGWAQHYKALVYYAEYLRGILKGLLFRRELTVPQFDFSIGEGSDVLQTLQYYVIGDPFAFFAVLSPLRLMPFYYTAAILLRLYLAGIAFSALCFQLGNQSRSAVLAGAVAYVFCYWALAQAGQHPFFLNPMLYLPLLALGVERMLRGKRPDLFLGAVTVSALSNFYFFYVLAWLVFLYVLARLFLLYRTNVRKIGLMILRIGAVSLFGVLISAVILLPTAYAVLTDARRAVGQTLRMAYPLSYYFSLPDAFLSPKKFYDLYLGFAAPVLPAVILLFSRRKEHTLLKLLFAGCCLMTVFPWAGQILNGFSYLSNKWCFAFALVAAYILTAMWPSMLRLKPKEAAVMVLGVGAYFALCLLSEYGRTKQVFAALLLCLFVVFVLHPGVEETFFTAKRRQRAVLFLTLFSVFLNSFWKNAVSEGDDANGMGRYAADILHQNETAAVAKAAAMDGAEDGYRYSGRELTANANMIAGISSTQYYWTLSNSKTFAYRSSLDVRENTVHRYHGYDDRAALNALAAVRYYAVPAGDGDPAPYGFSEIEEARGASSYRLYRNENPLPLAWLYESYLPEQSWQALSAVDKQNAMLQSVVLAEEASGVKRGEPVLDSQEIAFQITDMDAAVSMQGNAFAVTSENAGITLSFEGMADSETYLELTGLRFEGASQYDFYFGEERFDPQDLYQQSRWNDLDKTAQALIKKERFFWEAPLSADLMIAGDGVRPKELRYYTQEHPYYAGRHDFSVNVGYAKDARKEIKIRFSEEGIYSFDAMRVICQPMASYAGQIRELQKRALKALTLGTDRVSGQITAETPGILCFSLPYSAGWRARVDGQDARILQANVMHMGVELDAGSHEVELIYETPLLKEGGWVSLCGIVIWLCYLQKRRHDDRINGKTLQ